MFHIVLTSKDNLQRWKGDTREGIIFRTCHKMSHLTLFRPASNLGAIMIFVFQQYHHINCNVEIKDILTDGTRAAVRLATWLLIIQTKLFISQFFINFDTCYRTFQPWPPGMAPPSRTSSTRWRSDPVGLSSSRTMLSLRRWLTSTGGKNMREETVFSLICIALGERLFSFESLFNLLVKNLYQGANSREGGPCKRRRSFRLLWSKFV